LDETESIRDGDVPVTRDAISTTNFAPVAEIKKNRSESMAKEYRA